MRKVFCGLLRFLVAGIITLCYPLLGLSEIVEEEAVATKMPNTHEIHAPMVVAADEDVVFELSLNELYKNSLTGKELDFAKFAANLGMEVAPDGKSAICRREKAEFYVFYDSNGIVVYFENDYGIAIGLQILSPGKDVARTMYYVATRATVDLRELEKKKKQGQKLLYLPLSMMYRVATYEQGLYDDDGEPDFESLEKAKNSVDFYNLH